MIYDLEKNILVENGLADIPYFGLILHFIAMPTCPEKIVPVKHPLGISTVLMRQQMLYLRILQILKFTDIAFIVEIFS
mgnify:CR=1 FL=1